MYKQVTSEPQVTKQVEVDFKYILSNRLPNCCVDKYYSQQVGKFF